MVLFRQTMGSELASRSLPKNHLAWDVLTRFGLAAKESHRRADEDGSPRVVGEDRRVPPSPSLLQLWAVHQECNYKIRANSPNDCLDRVYACEIFTDQSDQAHAVPEDVECTPPILYVDVLPPQTLGVQSVAEVVALDLRLLKSPSVMFGLCPVSVDVVLQKETRVDAVSWACSFCRGRCDAGDEQLQVGVLGEQLGHLRGSRVVQGKLRKNKGMHPITILLRYSDEFGEELAKCISSDGPIPVHEPPLVEVEESPLLSFATSFRPSFSAEGMLSWPETKAVDSVRKRDEQ